MGLFSHFRNVFFFAKDGVDTYHPLPSNNHLPKSSTMTLFLERRDTEIRGGMIGMGHHKGVGCES